MKRFFISRITPHSSRITPHYSRLLPWTLVLIPWSLLFACASPSSLPTVTPIASPTLQLESSANATPLPTRALIEPGENLPYLTQSGDTVAAIAAHFNSSPEEVLDANPGLPLTMTIPSGMQLYVPAYYFPLGGPTFHIIPDSEFVYGPTSKDFDVTRFLQTQPGYIRMPSAYVAKRQRTSDGVIQYIANQYSINPKLLLALIEWRTNALSDPALSVEIGDNPLGPIEGVTGFYPQLLWAAERLSLGYYGWRAGTLTSIPLRDSYRSRVDMYQNAGTVGVQYLIGQLVPHAEFDSAAGPDGFAATYYALWGNPLNETDPPPDVIPGYLKQPELALPFASNQTWSLTGGPHPGWGDSLGLPWAALDFGPPGAKGCDDTETWITFSAPGLIVRSEDSTVVLDLDSDGYEQTGWALFHFHVAERGRIPIRNRVKTGDLLGYPSCEGGTATGVHVHIARKYNGEWIPASGISPDVVPFILGGWSAQAGNAPYEGKLVRLGAWVEACTCSSAATRVYWAR
jgi:LasA protease